MLFCYENSSFFNIFIAIFAFLYFIAIFSLILISNTLYIWLVSHGNMHEFGVWQIFLDQHESILFGRFISWLYFAISCACVRVCVCISGNEYNREEERNMLKKNLNLPCDGKYGKLWYSYYSDIRGSISFISLRIYVLTRFAAFFAFFAFYGYISFTYICYIYVYIVLYISLAYNFNLYTYMIFIIPDLSSFYFVIVNTGHIYYRITWSI